MLKYKHIPASVFNMYNFGTVGGGHSCAQVFYNNKWHFFDVTYAGIFEKDGNVLSWDEIISNPEDAMKHLVVFESTLDRWGGVNDDPVNRKKVDNNERMHIAYTVESLKNSKSYGFYRGSDVKTLYPLIDWGRINDNKVEIGKIDKDFGDVTTDGVEKQISEQLGVALGTGIDTFHTTWEFKNCVPNKEYILKYYVYKSTNSDLEFWVKGNNANITSGSSFKTDKALVEGNQEVWQIEFIPKSESCSVSIGYDFRDANKLVFTDKIDIEEAK